MEVLHHEQMEKTIVLTEKGMHLAAFWSRLLCGCGTSGRFEPIFAMENILPVFDRTFNYRIVEKTEWKRPQCEAAFYIPAENEIVIRSDVYEGAMNGVAMDVITVAHEVVHYLQAIPECGQNCLRRRESRNHGDHRPFVWRLRWKSHKGKALQNHRKPP